jgi:hypothetical protein
MDTRQETEPDDEETQIEISWDLFQKISNYHAEHSGEPMTLTAAEVCDLAGCAGEEAVQAARKEPWAADAMRAGPAGGEA